MVSVSEEIGFFGILYAWKYFNNRSAYGRKAIGDSYTPRCFSNTAMISSTRLSQIPLI